MAQVVRVNGDANGLVNFDVSISGVSSYGKPVSTGVSKVLTFLKISSSVFNNTVTPVTPANPLEDCLRVGGAVETALRTLQVAATTLAYQVNDGQLSVCCEATGWVEADLETALRAAGITGATVSSAGGFELA